MVKLFLALSNHENVCFPMPLQCLFSGFKCQNKAESRSIASRSCCELIVSTLNNMVLSCFNIAEIIVLTYFGAFSCPNH